MLINAIWILVLGILGASGLVIARLPQAKDVIAKIMPYQGWIGAVSAVWGVWGLIGSLRHFSLVGVLISGVSIALGLLLGVGVIKTFTPDSVDEKLDQLVVKLAPFQGILGLVAIGLGVWGIIGALFNA